MPIRVRQGSLASPPCMSTGSPGGLGGHARSCKNSNALTRYRCIYFFTRIFRLGLKKVEKTELRNAMK